MNILDIDLQKCLPEVIEIYTELFGKQYRSLIEQRVNSTKYVYYRNQQGITSYSSFLRYCKSKEIGLSFLKEIGIEVEDSGSSYADPYSDEAKELLLNFLGSSFTRVGFMDEKYSLSGVKSFDESRLRDDEDDQYEQRYLKLSQIRIINFLRGNDEIDEENYEEFQDTQEFQELKSRIEQYYETYKKLFNEYQEYLSEIQYYNDYAREEAKRRRKIADKYDNDWRNHADEIESEEVETSEDYIKNAGTFSDKRNAEKMKIAFINKQVCVQELLGTMNPILFFTIRNYDDGGKIDYMFLHEICHIITTSIREKKDEETVSDSKRIEEIKNERELRTDLISGNRVKSGFDCLSDFQFNPYNKNYRKYERLNETIVDIFAMEARKRLHSRGIYLFEDKDIVTEDISNANTSFRLKKMLAPLIKCYKEEVKQAMTGDDISPLTDRIGMKNFEEINDCINIADALLSGELHREYNEVEREKAIAEQEQRCKQVYDRIREMESSEQEEER